MEREIIRFREYETVRTKLTKEEVSILREKLSKVFSLSSIHSEVGYYEITAKHYVGTVILPEHILIVNPKIPNLNFFYMLLYAYDFLPDLFKNEFRYGEEHDIYEIIVQRLCDEIGMIVKKGLRKGYAEKEENLPYVRGKILTTRDLQKNWALRNRVFCRYEDFSIDVVENRISKYTFILFVIILSFKE